MKMLATAYLRTSSATNVDGDSPHRQSDTIMAFAARQGIEVVSSFWDAAVSGADPIEAREGFLALLAHCEADEIRTVVVEDRQRQPAVALHGDEVGGLMRETIRDSQYRTVGYIETDRHGRQRALNARFQTVGHFDPARNETRDGAYKVVARGNVLSALIWGR